MGMTSPPFTPSTPSPFFEQESVVLNHPPGLVPEFYIAGYYSSASCTLLS